MRDEPVGILVREMEPTARYRTLLTDRVGILREKDIGRLRVTWMDGRGPQYVHSNLIAEPWPREA